MKILIADDHPVSRKLLREQLEAEGHTVSEAVDGMTALAELKNHPVDAVITDILMPGMDGYRLCREIRRQAHLRELPIIAYTSTYLSQADEQLALRSGADCYVRKQGSAALLLEQLAGLQRSAAVRRPAEAPSDDPVVMQEYNSALIRKLEERSEELKERNTELQRANQELSESRARFESIITSAMDAIITIDERQHIVLVNAAAESMFGLTAAAMLGQPLERLLPARFRAGHAAHIRAFGDAGVTSRRMGALGAIFGQRANGDEFPLEASISKAEVAGQRFLTVILRDISARKQAEEMLRKSEESLRTLAVRLQSAREEERTSIAREIHDVLAQNLTSLKIDLLWLAKRNAQPSDEQQRGLLQARISEAVARTDEAISTVQRIATELRPVILDSLGLAAAVEWQMEDFERRTGLNSRTRTTLGESALGRAAATAVFRILQESLTNVVRHSGATAVEVQLTEDASAVTLTVQDNGSGIAADRISDPRSIGLVGMRERAQAFGGTIEITGTSGVGTTVQVRVPLDQNKTYKA